jgi:hypothetical protein
MYNLKGSFYMNEAQALPDYSNGVLTKVRDNMKNTQHLSQVLEKARIVRSMFDPDSAEDRAVYATYLQTGRWVRMFYCEKPSLSVTATIERKLVEYSLRDVVQATEKMVMEVSQRKVVKVVKEVAA